MLNVVRVPAEVRTEVLKGSFSFDRSSRQSEAKEHHGIVIFSTLPRLGVTPSLLSNTNVCLSSAVLSVAFKLPFPVMLHRALRNTRGKFRVQIPVLRRFIA